MMEQPKTPDSKSEIAKILKEYYDSKDRLGRLARSEDLLAEKDFPKLQARLTEIADAYAVFDDISAKLDRMTTDTFHKEIPADKITESPELMKLASLVNKQELS